MLGSRLIHFTHSLRATSSSLLWSHAPRRCMSFQKQPLASYQNMVEQGILRNDPRQHTAMTKLNDLYVQLQSSTSSSTSSHSSSSQRESTPISSSPFQQAWSFASKWLPQQTSSHATHAITPYTEIKGLYMYGGVGSGKTMLMDLFYQHLTGIKRIRRHFHPFMLDIHARLHRIRTDPKQKYMQDPLTFVAREFVTKEAHVLCLDEFQVTDVADAMILKTLFTALWDAGCVVVATSNRAPKDLYLNGINRDVFLPFIDELQQRCMVWAIEQGQDHRLLGTISQGLYHSPLNDTTKQSMNEIFSSLSAEAGDGDDIAVQHPIGPRTIPVMMGRSLNIPMASHQVARFTFQQLCETALGAADYIALANKFKYVMIDEVPIIRFDQREKLRRFITLLDILYEHNVCLILSAEAPLAQLFQSAPADTFTSSSSTTEIKDETFASARALSRLTEMQSQQYLHRMKMEQTE